MCSTSSAWWAGRKKRLAPCSTGAGTQPWSRRERDRAAQADLAQAEFSRSDSSPTGLMPTEGINSELCSLLHPRAISTDVILMMLSLAIVGWSHGVRVQHSVLFTSRKGSKLPLLCPDRRFQGRMRESYSPEPCVRAPLPSWGL